MSTKTIDPQPDRFPTDNHTPRSQQVFNISSAQCEAVVRPDCPSNDLTRKAEPLQARHVGRNVHDPLITRSSQANNLAIPPHAQQDPGKDRPDDIDPALGIPVMLPGAALSTRCIPMGAGHVMGKTTPVNLDNGPGIALMGITPFPKPLPRVLVCFRVRQGFFHMSRPVCEAPAIWPSVSHQTAQRAPVGSGGMVSHLLRKLLRVDLSDLPTLVGPGSIRLAQRLIEAIPTENRSAVSPGPKPSLSRTERTCRQRVQDMS